MSKLSDGFFGGMFVGLTGGMILGGILALAALVTMINPG
jgi:hypothetical protein